MEQNVGLGTLDSTDTPMGMPLSLGFTGPLTATVDTMADFTQAADFNIVSGVIARDRAVKLRYVGKLGSGI